MYRLLQHFLHKRRILPYGIKQSILTIVFLSTILPHVREVFFQTQIEIPAVATTYARVSEKSVSAAPMHVKPISQVVQLVIGKKDVSPTPSELPETKRVWGVAKQVDETTWTMQIGNDEHIGSAQEIFAALNVYRQRNGRGTVQWDEGLAAYARSRVDLYVSMHATDKHAGFLDFIHSQDGFKKLGFNSLGENASFGYQLAGVHLIEWVYAGDKPHDDNQLNSSWTHVGIGVRDLATDLIFGGSKQ